eukprot:9502253-Pyramimonas_sp.AAC.1
MARDNNKKSDPNEDEQEFWEEGSGHIQIGINGSPRFRAVPPKNAREDAIAKLVQFAGRNLR